MDEITKNLAGFSAYMQSITILIATSGRDDALRDTLESLGSVRAPAGFAVELLLIENVSKGGAEAILAQTPQGSLSSKRYIFTPTSGKSKALNLALTRAVGNIIIFSDDDVRFPVDWLTQLCEPLLDGTAEAVAGGVRIADHLVRPWMNHTHRAWLASTADYISNHNPSEMCGANMAILKTTIVAMGGFDEQLGPGVTGGGEESLLSWQIKKAGLRIVARPKAVVEHHFLPNRLQYTSWLKAAALKGQTRAYLTHHWHGKTIKFAALKLLYYRAKLWIRTLISPSRPLDSEGIYPWELSYIESIAMLTHYRLERARPRKYVS